LKSTETSLRRPRAAGALSISAISAR